MTKRRKQRQDKLIAMAGHINPAADVWKNFCRHTVSVIALAVLIAMIIAAIAAGFIFDYDTDVTGIFSDRLLGIVWRLFLLCVVVPILGTFFFFRSSEDEI